MKNITVCITDEQYKSIMAEQLHVIIRGEKKPSISSIMASRAFTDNGQGAELSDHPVDIKQEIIPVVKQFDPHTSHMIQKFIIQASQDSEQIDSQY